MNKRRTRQREDYVHRVGRAGQRAVSLVTPSEAELLRQIQRLGTTPLERVPLHIVSATRAKGGGAPLA